MKLESTTPAAISLKAVIVFHAVLFCFLNTGCVSVSEKHSNEPDTFVTCSEPRQEVCTQDYVPVYGYRVDGSQKTYSNACSACADKKITNYKVNACL